MSKVILSWRSNFIIDVLTRYDILISLFKRYNTLHEDKIFYTIDNWIIEIIIFIVKINT